MTNTETEQIHWIKTEIVVIQRTISQTVSTQQTAISRTPSIQAKSETIRMKGILDLLVSSLIAEVKAADETISHVMDPEIRYRIIRDEALLTNTGNQPTNSRRHDNFQNTQRNSSNSHSQPCRHCGRSNHFSNECKACFICKRIGHFRRDCKAPRANSLK